MPDSLTMDGISNQNQARRLPGEPGVWVFILGDMVIFSLFFSVFLFYRAADVELFNRSQALLNLNYGAVNTLILLTSSWFVVMGLNAVRKSLPKIASRCFALALLCGLLFSGIKIAEYSEKIAQGITLTSNDFFMYYYIYTGIHFLHLIVGMGALVFLLLKSRQASFSDDDVKLFESGAAYWHMVDLLWIVIFPLLYMVK